MTTTKWMTLAVVLCMLAATAACGAGEAKDPATGPLKALEWRSLADGGEWQVGEAGMEGLAEVRVAVAPMDPEFCRFLSINQHELQTQTELYLRRVPGIRVTSDPAPYIYVRVTGLVQQSVGGYPMGYAASVDLDLRQAGGVYRTRTKVLVMEVSTWRRGYLITGGQKDGAQFVREVLERLLDDFQNEYLKANPQSEQTNSNEE